MGRNCRLYGLPIVRSPHGAIIIGDGVTLVSDSWRSGATGLGGRLRLRTFLASAKIIIEKNVGISGGSITARSGTIRIGNDTMIGPDCMIVDSDFHLLWPPERRRIYDSNEADADVVIGSQVWIGARCIILKGVIIGENSVIAAGSVVTRSIPANCLAAGSPATVKRRLF
jgi:acetyltransferase-like isoleucine patch superfamily enzyme